MADVTLDTPTAVFGIPSGLVFDARPYVAYTRLSPQAPAAAQWWLSHTVVDVELPATQPVAETGDGGWVVTSRFMLARPEDVHGVVTAQHGVSGAYVKELTRTAAAPGPVPWGPVLAGRIGKALWLLDGNHRAAAAVAAGRRTHPARVVDLDDLPSCPCGWQGPGQSWWEHPCTQIALG